MYEAYIPNFFCIWKQVLPLGKWRKDLRNINASITQKNRNVIRPKDHLKNKRLNIIDIK
jgi:hypothetical protein